MWNLHPNDMCRKAWGISLKFWHMDIVASQMKVLADLVEMHNAHANS